MKKYYLNTGIFRFIDIPINSYLSLNCDPMNTIVFKTDRNKYKSLKTGREFTLHGATLSQKVLTWEVSIHD